jgi:hypothetical protein
MNKVRQIFLFLLTVFISILIIDRGKNITVNSTTIQTSLDCNKGSDVEIPYHLDIFEPSDDEKWIETAINEFSFLNKALHLFPCLYREIPEDYQVSVWEPPESC